MRRLLPFVLSVAAAPALVVAPVVAMPVPDARPVEPVVQTLALAGVDTRALAEVRAAAPRLAAQAAVPQTLELVDATPQERAAAAAAPEPEALTAQLETDDFGLVGVNWTSPQVAGVTVLVRVREAGRWSAWEYLAGTDGGPDAGSAEAERARGGTEPLLTSGADGVQVRVDSADGTLPAGLRMTLVDPGTSDADAHLDGVGPVATADAATAAPTIITRAQWGADESLAGGTSRSTTLKAMTVHHTASTNTYSGASGAAAQLRSIYAYHVLGNGWSDIGYNFVIDKSGNVFEGRKHSIDELVVGAHAGGFNSDTMGVSALGNYEAASAPAALVESIARVAAWKLGTFGVDPRGTTRLVSAGGGTSRYPAGAAVTVDNVFAHRDVGLTACPGAALFSKMSTIRSLAATAAPADPPLVVSGQSVSDSTPDYATGSTVLTASFNKAMPWRVVITSMCRRDPVRTLSGSGRSIQASWDLRADDGSWASPGVYRVAYLVGDSSWVTDIEVQPTVHGPQTGCSTARIAGDDRYATSVAEGRAAYPTGSAVVIVSGAAGHVVDGLVAGPLARAWSAPLLMVAPTSVPPVVADDIVRRGARSAYVVGGTGAVSPQVEAQLRALGITSIRRYAGRDRFETAAMVARAVGAPQRAAVVASGRSLVDAVAAAGPAARLHRPVLLVDTRAVPASTADAIRRLGITSATVVGGTGVVSEGVRSSLGIASTPRVAGVDRYATAAAVARAFAPLVGTQQVLLASGIDGQVVDALAGSAMGRVTLLTTPGGLPAATQTALPLLAPDALVVLGGPSAVSTATLRTAHVAAFS